MDVPACVRVALLTGAWAGTGAGPCGAERGPVEVWGGAEPGAPRPGTARVMGATEATAQGGEGRGGRAVEWSGEQRNHDYRRTNKPAGACMSTQTMTTIKSKTK